jgi:hypothetical protein
MRLLLVLITLVGLPGTARSQGARLLVPRVDTFAVYLIRGTDTTRTGTIVDEIAVIAVNGDSALRRVYRSTDEVLGQRLDTLVDAFPSLSPRTHRSRSSRGMEFLQFSGGRVSGWLRLVNGDSVAIDQPIDSGVFNASSLDLVLRTSALTPTWQATIHVFLPSTKGVVPMQARVSGTDVIRGSRAWRITADFAGTPVTFWVDQTSRALVQQVMRVGVDVEILFARPSEKVPKGRAT